MPIMLSCETGEFAAVCAGKAKMKHIDDEVIDLALKLEPKIKAMTNEGEITIKVKHGWVASIGTFIIDLYNKVRTVD